MINRRTIVLKNVYAFGNMLDKTCFVLFSPYLLTQVSEWALSCMQHCHFLLLLNPHFLVLLVIVHV